MGGRNCNNCAHIQKSVAEEPCRTCTRGTTEPGAATGLHWAPPGGVIAPVMPPALDAEIAALATCVEALAPLDLFARLRTLEYLRARLDDRPRPL